MALQTVFQNHQIFQMHIWPSNTKGTQPNNGALSIFLSSPWFLTGQSIRSACWWTYNSLHTSKHFNAFKSSGYSSHWALLAFKPVASEPLLWLMISLNAHFPPLAATKEGFHNLNNNSLHLPAIPFLYVPVGRTDRYLAQPLLSLPFSYSLHPYSPQPPTLLRALPHSRSFSEQAKKEIKHLSFRLVSLLTLSGNWFNTSPILCKFPLLGAMGKEKSFIASFFFKE